MKVGNHFAVANLLLFFECVYVCMNILDADVACYSVPALKSFVTHTQGHTPSHKGVRNYELVGAAETLLFKISYLEPIYLESLS